LGLNTRDTIQVYVFILIQRGTNIFFGTRFHKFLRLPALLPVAIQSRKYLRKRTIPELEQIRYDREFVYRYFESQFRFRSPYWLWRHNHYFKLGSRGFGEPAFHSAWYAVLKHYRPRRLLEIGVYRGQVLSLWSLIGKQLDFPVEVTGLSPFENIGDEVSSYKNLDFVADIESHYEYFGLPDPLLVKMSSTSECAKSIIEHGKWDLVYIDGSHNLPDVISDYESALTGLSDSGVLVLDDSSLYLDQRLHPGRFSGHPGPSEVCQNRAIPEMDWFLSVGHLNFFRKRQ